MDNRINDIIRTISCKSRICLFSVGGVESSIHNLNVGKLKVDTVFSIAIENKRDVWLYFDSQQSHSLRLIVAFDESDINGNTYAGVPFSQRQDLEVNLPFVNKYIILSFDESITIKKNIITIDAKEAMVRSSIYLCLYFIRKNPNRYFSIELNDNNERANISSSSQPLSSGEVVYMGNNSYMISFDCDLIGGKPSEEEVCQIVKECFNPFAHVDNVQVYTCLLNNTIEFIASI